MMTRLGIRFQRAGRECSRKTAAFIAAVLLVSCGIVPAPALELARELHEDGDWRQSRLEALRVLAAHPEHEEAQLMVWLSTLRQKDYSEELFAELQSLADAADAVKVRTRAAYELGRELWRAGERDAALHYLQTAFRESPSRELFLLSGYSLYRLLRERPRLIGPDDPLRRQLETVRPLWTREVRRAAAPPRAEPRDGLAAGLGKAVIAFYQSQIGPAIGQRCSMHPSCSHYSAEAMRRHGLMGLPLTADRVIREPDHVSQRLRPVVIDGEEKYFDPVDHHDWWWYRAEESK